MALDTARKRASAVGQLADNTMCQTCHLWPVQERYLLPVHGLCRSFQVSSQNFTIYGSVQCN